MYSAKETRMDNPINTVVRTVVQYSPALVKGVLTTNTCTHTIRKSIVVYTCRYTVLFHCQHMELLWEEGTCTGMQRTSSGIPQWDFTIHSVLLHCIDYHSWGEVKKTSIYT